MGLSVVVVGSGSAGRRHVAALRAAVPEAHITVVRRPDSTGPTGILTAASARMVGTLDEALRDGVTIGVVAGPAPAHAGATVALAKAGATVLVEKPLTDDAASARRLVDDVAATGRQLVVGYHLRFGDTLPALRRALDAGTIGAPTGFALRVGQHLSAWRPGTDPAASVSARAELGGGALLELSHELDALRFLLGDAVEVTATLDHHGAPTDGLVETVADLAVRTADGVTGTVHLDMVSDPPDRTWRIGGPDGELIADLLTGRIDLIRATGMRADGVRADGAGTPVERVGPGERDRAEVRLIDHLLDVHAGRARPRCTGADGIAVLDVVAAARRSATTGRIEPVTGLGRPAGQPAGTP